MTGYEIKSNNLFSFMAKKQAAVVASFSVKRLKKYKNAGTFYDITVKTFCIFDSSFKRLRKIKI